MPSALESKRALYRTSLSAILALGPTQPDDLPFKSAAARSASVHKKAAVTKISVPYWVKTETGMPPDLAVLGKTGCIQTETCQDSMVEHMAIGILAFDHGNEAGGGPGQDLQHEISGDAPLLQVRDDLAADEARSKAVLPEMKHRQAAVLQNKPHPLIEGFRLVVPVAVGRKKQDRVATGQAGKPCAEFLPGHVRQRQDFQPQIREIVLQIEKGLEIPLASGLGVHHGVHRSRPRQQLP